MIERLDVFRYVPVELVTTPPATGGRYLIIVDYWMVRHPERGLVFSRSHPVMNQQQHLAEAVAKNLHPDFDVVHVDHAYLPIKPHTVDDLCLPHA